jgi:hypothetical protein
MAAHSVPRTAMNLASVSGLKYVIKKGKTPVLTPEQERLLLDYIDVRRRACRC